MSAIRGLESGLRVTSPTFRRLPNTSRRRWTSVQPFGLVLFPADWQNELHSVLRSYVLPCTVTLGYWEFFREMKQIAWRCKKLHSDG